MNRTGKTGNTLTFIALAITAAKLSAHLNKAKTLRGRVPRSR
jgi:hypothetical protein